MGPGLCESLQHRERCAPPGYCLRHQASTSSEECLTNSVFRGWHITWYPLGTKDMRGRVGEREERETLCFYRITWKRPPQFTRESFSEEQTTSFPRAAFDKGHWTLCNHVKSCKRVSTHAHVHTNLLPTNPCNRICGDGVLITHPSAASSTCLNITFHHPEYHFF